MTESEQFTIRGQVGSPAFAGWIRRHGGKLGLKVDILSQSDTLVDLIVAGPEPLRDAMALGCSLGPWDVWVDDIIRKTC